MKRKFNEAILPALLLLLLLLSFSSLKAQYDWTNEKPGLKGQIKKTIVTDSIPTLKNGVQVMYAMIGRVTSFNTTGNVTIEYWGKPERPFGKRLYTYDEKGALSKLETFGIDNTPSLYYLFTCNPEGKIIEYTVFKPDGMVIGEYSTVYDDRNNKTGDKDKKTGKFKDGKTYKYDGKNYISEEVIAQVGFKSYTSQRFKYDDNGNKIERQVYYANGDPLLKYTYSYDTNGDMIAMNDYKADGSLSFTTTYVYEYDSKGNWIKKTAWNEKDGQPKTLLNVTQRLIEYY